MRIQHNISALNSWRQLGINQNASAKNLEKLSSGYRINRAGDDAAGLAISEKMRGQIRGLDMASKNAQDGISLIQTAEGALDETHSILQRMRELAVQSANGTYQDEDRQNTDLEVQALKEELNRIASSTHFNKIQLLDGSLSGEAGKAGTAGKAAAKVTISENAELTSGAKTVNKAMKGIYQTSMGGLDPFNAIQADATNEYTISYKDANGELKNETVSIRFDSDNQKIVDANGNTLKATKTTTATVDETVEALKIALENSNIGKSFKIETKNGDGTDALDVLYRGSAATKDNGNEGLKFTAKTAGASEPVLLSITQNNGDIGTKAVGQGTMNGKTITVDLSNIDIGKIKVGDKLTIGGQEMTFEWASTTAASAGDKYVDNGNKIYLSNIKTTDDLAEAIAGALSTESAAGITLKSNSTFGGLASGATFGLKQDGTNKSLLTVSLGTSLSNTTDQMRDDVQTFMTNFVYTPTGTSAVPSVTGGYIGLGTSPKVYDVVTTQTATDRYESYDMAVIKAWNPGNQDDDIADHVIDVNGEKFLFVKQDAKNQSITDDVITKATAIYGNSLNVVTINSANNSQTEGVGVPVTELDVLNMAERIKEKTGTNVRVNGTKLEFLATPGTKGTEGTDGKLTFQIGANGSADQRVTMSIDDMSAKGIGVDAVDITTVDNSNKAIDIIDKAINTVSATRANLGAMQNRLEHTINSLNTSSENLTAAESRIRDVDMAKEMMQFTKNNILTQAAQAMLAQANQQPQGVLQLLQ